MVIIILYTVVAMYLTAVLCSYYYMRSLLEESVKKVEKIIILRVRRLAVSRNVRKMTAVFVQRYREEAFRNLLLNQFGYGVSVFFSILFDAEGFEKGFRDGFERESLQSVIESLQKLEGDGVEEFSEILKDVVKSLSL